MSVIEAEEDLREIARIKTVLGGDRAALYIDMLRKRARALEDLRDADDPIAQFKKEQAEAATVRRMQALFGCEPPEPGKEDRPCPPA